MPVIYAAAGNCHVYVDARRRPRDGAAIAYNAKVQRPGVCNAAETLLVHRDIASKLIPEVFGDLHAAGVELLVDPARARAAGGAATARPTRRTRTGTPSTSA